jgi:hypothetical protein
MGVVFGAPLVGLGCPFAAQVEISSLEDTTLEKKFAHGNQPVTKQMQQRGAQEDVDGNMGLAASLGGRRWSVVCDEYLGAVLSKAMLLEAAQLLWSRGGLGSIAPLLSFALACSPAAYAGHALMATLVL